MRLINQKPSRPVALMMAAIPFIGSLSLIPPITVLPILFIVFGLGQVSKVALIVFGTAPVMIRIASPGCST